MTSLPGLVIAEELSLDTKYGKPSDLISVGELGGHLVAFLPRHGKDHLIPPHKVPYKANLAALQSLGVRHVIGTCVVGSLRREIEPGTFVVPDQFINLTWGRDDTFNVDLKLIHLPMANPYCAHIRGVINGGVKAMRLKHESAATLVVIQGPRFSTIAESKMYALLGGDVVNMTQYPECYFARELGLCYGVVATVTDYDVGVPSAISMQPGSMDTVLEIFRENTAKTVQLLERLARDAPKVTQCRCSTEQLSEYYKLAGLDGP